MLSEERGLIAFGVGIIAIGLIGHAAWPHPPAEFMAGVLLAWVAICLLVAR